MTESSVSKITGLELLSLLNKDPLRQGFHMENI